MLRVPHTRYTWHVLLLLPAAALLPSAIPATLGTCRLLGPPNQRCIWWWGGLQWSQLLLYVCQQRQHCFPLIDQVLALLLLQLLGRLLFKVMILPEFLEALQEGRYLRSPSLPLSLSGG